MKRLSISILVGILAAISGAFGQPAPDTSALIGALKSFDETARRAAWEALAPAGAAAIKPLFDLMGDEDLNTDLAARQAVQNITHYAAGPNGAGQRAAVAQALAAEARSGSSLRVRTFAVRMLSFVGGDEVVGELSGLLGEPDMHEIARWALVRIPGEASTRALADALPGADAEFKVALINALGARADRAAIPVVRPALSYRDEAVRIAAMQALARVGDAGSRGRLLEAEGARSERESTAAREAYIHLAEALVARGEDRVAADMYREVYRSKAPERYRCAGLAGLARASGPGALPTILSALGAREPRIRGTVREALASAPGEGFTRALERATADATGERLVTLIQALGQRGDRWSLPAVQAAASNADPAVRLAAVAALGRLSNPDAAPTLIAALGSPDEAERNAALVSLVEIPGTRVDRSVRAALPDAAPGVRAALLRVLGRRRDYRALPAMMEALNDDDAGVRLAALEAVGRLHEAEAMPALLQVLRRAEGVELDAARAALAKIRGPEAEQAMVAAVPDSPDPVKAALIGALAAREDPALRDLFAEAAQSEDDAVAVAGLDALSRLRDPSAAPVFLAVAEKGSEKTKAAAVMGYLSIADARGNEDPAAALAIYSKALQLATRDEERRLALQGLGRIADPAALPLVRSYLERGRLRREAAAAAVPIARRLANRGQRDEAIGLLRRAVEVTNDRAVIRDAAGTLRRLGVELDLAAEGGFVTHWWVLGPFTDRKRMTATDVVPTDAAIDLAGEVRDGDRMFSWKYAPVDDPLGMLDFEREVARMDDCGAYAYAEVTSDVPRDVVFQVGSDDSFFCWLNGKLVGQFVGDRGWAADQTQFDAHLNAGPNRILLKVLNGGAQWASSLRITQADGTPVRLEERRP